MKRWLTAILIVSVGAARVHAAPPVYDDYRAVLMAFVDDGGLVDYRALFNHAFDDLEDFTRYLAELNPRDYDAWSARDRLAFWINTYNALTLRAVIHNPVNGGPVRSIRDIPGVWDQMPFVVMGKPITLDEIENQKLRAFKEPRVHMALVCAAMGCPKLRREPYEGAKLEAQLDDQVRDFLADPRHFYPDRARGTVRVSEIFKWYAGDFAPVSVASKAPRVDMAVRNFAAPYLNEADREFLEHARIEYTPYDWTLNEQPR